MKIILIFGFVPFLIPIVTGIYAAITGYSGLSVGPAQYGFAAFMEWVFTYSLLYWPTYVIGVVLLVIVIIKRKRTK